MGTKMQSFARLWLAMMVACWITPLAGQDGHRWVNLDPLEAEEPLRIGQQKQLLVDNEMLADWWKLRRVQSQVKKHPQNPVLEADQLWEESARRSWGILPTAVLHDAEEGRLKLWYKIYQKDNGAVVAYATSSNGVHWTKPYLGLVEFAGTSQNNLCRIEPLGRPMMGSLHLVQEPRESSSKSKYRAIGIAPFHEDGTPYGGWLGVAVSSDGTSWHLQQGGLREGGGGGNPSCVWDEGLGRYVLFHRQLTERALARGSGRYIVRQETRGFRHWSPRKTVFNSMGPRWPEVESMMVFRHEGIYFGLPQMLETEIRGEVEIHLATSRDGYRWEHPFPKQPFIPRGPRGEFDDMITWFGQMAIRGEEMLFFYGGTRYAHSKPGPPIVDDGQYLKFTATTPPGKGHLVYRQNRIGLATVPLDRLIGLRADEPVGAFLTRPFVVEGDELYLNADVDRELRVEVVHPVGKLMDIGKKSWIGHYIAGREEIVSGYSATDCQAVVGDSLTHQVRWKGGSLGKLKGKAVRLRIMARMATVYAFQVR